MRNETVMILIGVAVGAVIAAGVVIATLAGRLKCVQMELDRKRDRGDKGNLDRWIEVYEDQRQQIEALRRELNMERKILEATRSNHRKAVQQLNKWKEKEGGNA